MAEKRRYLMYLSYIGTNFWGSQYQWSRSTGAVYPTVQNSLEKALQCIFKLEGERPLVCVFNSRTDSGVHALKAPCFVDLPCHPKFINPLSLKYTLNRYFSNSDSIRILDVVHVPDSFTFVNACKSKTYLYRIGVLKEEFCSDNKLNKNFVPPITELHRTYFIGNQSWDIKKVEEVLPLFIGKKDFATFCRKPSKNFRPTVCEILSFTVENTKPQMPCDYEHEKYNYYHFICTGTRFLYHMVRSMVGTAISVGLGRTTVNEVKMLFDKPEPSSWLNKIIVSPAYGLYLVETNLDPKKLIAVENTKDSLLESESSGTLSSAEAA